MDETNVWQKDLIDSFKKDETFEALIDKLTKEHGMQINDKLKIHFKQHLTKFIVDFKKLTDQVLKLEGNSNAITNEFNQIIDVCNNLDAKINVLIFISSNENIKSKIWPMFVFKYYSKVKKKKIWF